MTKSKSKLTGWILSILLALFLIGASASGKFTEWEGKAQMFEKMGFTTDLMFKIGILEVIIAILFVIPRTGFLGAILLTGYLGGATLTHLRVGEPFFVPILIGVVAWVALGLRQPKVFALALGTNLPDTRGPS
jgi:DoxX-like family